MITDRSYTML